MIWMTSLMLQIFNPGWYWVIIQIVNSMVLSCVKVFGHQQSYWSIGSGVVHKYTTYSTVLQMCVLCLRVTLILLTYCVYV